MKSNFFVEDNRIKDQTRKIHSPSGEYCLVIDYYTTRKGCWNYSRGVVFDKNNKKIADIKRNYHSFWYAWAEKHPNGHDYLLCGHNYQGQTVVELDTRTKKSYLPKEAKQGFAWCWADVKVSPNCTKVAVEGCVWGAPYDLVIYDFSNPMNLPYKLIPVLYDEDLGDEKWDWVSDDEISLESQIEVRKSDKKPVWDIEEDVPNNEVETLSTKRTIKVTPLE